MTTVDVQGTVSRAMRGILRGGGATVSVVTGHSPTWGYIVGDGRHERIVKVGEESLLGALHQYVNDNRASLAWQGNYLGAWLDDDGALYLDVSEWVTDREKALDLAEERGELAVYDVLSGTCLWVADRASESEVQAAA